MVQGLDGFGILMEGGEGAAELEGGVEVIGCGGRGELQRGDGLVGLAGGAEDGFSG
jgi:hypothetical protein